MLHLRQKLGNNGGLPHMNSVEGAKMSSVILLVSNLSHKLVFHLLVQCLGTLPDATGKAIVNESGLENFRESGVDIHDTSSCNAAPVVKHRNNFIIPAGGRQARSRLSRASNMSGWGLSLIGEWRGIRHLKCHHSLGSAQSKMSIATIVQKTDQAKQFYGATTTLIRYIPGPRIYITRRYESKCSVCD